MEYQNIIEYIDAVFITYVINKNLLFVWIYLFYTRIPMYDSIIIYR